MKRQLFRIVLLVIALAIGFWLMSCATGPEKTNQTSITEAEKSGSDHHDCSKKGIEDEMKKILTGNGGNIEYVAEQYKGPDPDHPSNDPWNIDVRVLTYTNGQKVVVIEGELSDGRPENQGKNREIMELVTKAVDELITKNCVFKAVFVERGTLERLDKNEINPDTIAGFNWSSCDWPTVACPGGVCSQPPCARLVNGNTANQNSNANGNSSSNGNANSNSNINSNGNRP